MADRVTRARRDIRVLNLFIAGSTYKQIGDHPEINLSPAQVHRIVTRELAKAAKRREVVADEALALFIERSEALLKAHWPRALRGDYKSSVIVDRQLSRQARLFGLVDGMGNGGGTGAGEPPEDSEADAEDGETESVTDIDKYRRRHGLA